jgi:hypothetical protein
MGRVLPEQAIKLPGGLVRANERRVDEATLRTLSGCEEEWLAANRGVPSAIAVTHLLTSCLVQLGDAPPAPQTVRQLLVGDRDFLMLQLRRLTLGDHIRAVFACQACEARMDVDFESADVPVQSRPQQTAAYTVQVGFPPRTVRFRLPCGEDQEAVLTLDAGEAARELLDRCVLDGAGELTDDDREAISSEMERLAPQMDLELDLVCPECGVSFVAPFDITSFFLSEMSVRPQDLLREVHWLAFHYHWSESEILNLRRDRRRAYLALLSDTLRPE